MSRLIILLLLFPCALFGAVNINIDNNQYKVRLLFVGFDANSDAEQILQKIISNLKTTNLSENIVKDSTKQQTEISDFANAVSQEKFDINTPPDFNQYQKTNIDAIIVADTNYDSLGNLELKVRMWDVFEKKQIFGKYYSASKDLYRKVSNLISNEIYRSISGENQGHFNSQILYVSETGSFKNRIKKISVIDFDGENYRNLTDGSEIVLTPIFSKKRDEIFYLRYFQNKPQIFLLNANTGRTQKIGGFRSTTLAPSTHPLNHNKMLITAIEDGNSDIFEIDTEQNTARRLTSINAIDTTASYSPDGKKIVFASDRSGSQQLYIMSADGLAIEKISQGSGSYSKPMWSPDGKLIAFTKMKGGRFYIGTMSSNGGNEKILVNAYLAEGAKWSPNGRYLIYSKKTAPYGKESIPKLYIIDINTGFEYKIPTPENEGAIDPDWI
jgi:TolB protein